MIEEEVDGRILDHLYKIVASRKGGDIEASHTARLFHRGTAYIAQKVGEEAVETVIEGVGDSNTKLADESADLLYHLLVLWAARDLDPRDVWLALEGRKGISGLVEKASRPSDTPDAARVKGEEDR